MDVSGVVLVEGPSDQVAVETLARRRGRDLAEEGIAVVSVAGITNMGRFVERFGPRGLDVRIAGLYDAGEEHALRRGLARAGLDGADDQSLERHGFFVCDLDLEDELIRALGHEHVERLLALEGDLRSFRTLQQQPDQRDRPVGRQLRRFMGTRRGRKIHYAAAMTAALDPDEIPRPLDGVLAWTEHASGASA